MKETKFFIPPKKVTELVVTKVWSFDMLNIITLLTVYEKNCTQCVRLPQIEGSVKGQIYAGCFKDSNCDQTFAKHGNLESRIGISCRFTNDGYPAHIWI